MSTRVLGSTDRPVLLVGPMVSLRSRITWPTLVIGVGPMEHAGVAVSTIASWTQTFPGDDPWVVQVVPTAGRPGDSADTGVAAHVRSYVELLAGAVAQASSRVFTAANQACGWRTSPDKSPTPSSSPRAPAGPMPSAMAQRDPRARAPLGAPSARRSGRRGRPTAGEPGRRVQRRLGGVREPAAVEESLAAIRWELARTCRVGWLAVNVRGWARIFPINFVVDDETIVFRTALGKNRPLPGVPTSSSRSFTTTHRWGAPGA